MFCPTGQVVFIHYPYTSFRLDVQITVKDLVESVLSLLHFTTEIGALGMILSDVPSSYFSKEAVSLTPPRTIAP